MPLHVLQLGPYPPPEGGISRNILAIRDGLRSAGHRGSIIATSRSSGIVDEPDVYHPRSTMAFISLLRKLKFDILHLHIGGDVSLRVLGLALVCSIFGKKRSVLTMHSGGFALSKAARSAERLSLAGLIFRRFSKIIAVNNDLADVFRRFGIEPGRISVIPPYSLQVPDETVKVPDALAVFCQKHKPLLLAVGGLEKEYDPLMQIEAMTDIVRDLPDAGLMIVGGGSMLAEVTAAVEASGCTGNIYLAGNVEHAVTLHLMKDADIFLRTTLFDGDAISVREALFLGTPVIATDTGERPDGVHLIGIGDKNALVGRIEALAKNAKQKTLDQPPDISNIAAVLRMYGDLA
ncbi:MAG: glycosyltransferase family 4 protein [Pyrinomonadaceae bacterium]